MHGAAAARTTVFALLLYFAHHLKDRKRGSMSKCKMADENQSEEKGMMLTIGVLTGAYFMLSIKVRSLIDYRAVSL